MRIELLRRIARLQSKVSGLPDQDDAMAELQKQYVIGSVLIDFFPQVMWAAKLAGTTQAEDDYITTVASLPDDDERLESLSDSLFEHFTTLQSLKEISQATLDKFYGSSLGRKFCEANYILRGQVSSLLDDFASYCWRAVKSVEGRWKSAAGTCSSKFYEFTMIGTEFHVKDQSGVPHVEHINGQTDSTDFDTVEHEDGKATENSRYVNYHILDSHHMTIKESKKTISLSRC
jgi:hypothetical protein